MRFFKKTILAFLECPRLGYFESNAEPARAREEGEDAARRLHAVQGRLLGERARREFPRGILIEGKDFGAALRATRRAIASGSRVLYEAAFVSDSVGARPDLLVREGRDRWRLWEVKSGTETREEHLRDLAVQLHVMDGLGMRGRGGLMLVDRETTNESPTIFRRVDCDAEARERIPAVREAARELARFSRLAEKPPAALGRACRDCEFRNTCWPDLPSPSVLDFHQGEGGWRNVEKLLGAGIADLSAVPPTASLTRVQKRQVVATRSRRLVAERGARSALTRAVRRPLHFLDFEAARFPVPLFTGQHPYDLIPFQWSCHIDRAPDTFPEHRDFLWTDGGDPSRAFAESLLRETESKGSVIVYSSFEQETIQTLAERFPDLRAPLESLHARIFDLLPVLRRHFYHPDFGGSFSIKSVLPVLVPGRSYDSLAIGDGLEAVWAYYRLTRETIPEEERTRLTTSLRVYCEQDSLALRDVYHALLRQTEESAT